MNYRHPLPMSLTKYTNIINRPMARADLTTVVSETVGDLLGEAPHISDMIVDLHYSIIKEISAMTPFSCDQAIRVAKGLTALR